MKAMIFAAGFGTRLRPLTDKTPKVMLPIGGQPLLKIILDRLYIAGIQEVVVNVHYLPDVIERFLKNYQKYGMTIHISDESDAILETGGGLLRAQKYFDDGHPFLLANGDILTNIDIELFAKAHQNLGGIATLAVKDRPSNRKLLFSKDGSLIGRADDNAEGIALAFSGYHMINPDIFTHLTRQGKFSITDWYLDICQQEKIYAYLHPNDIWVDIGTVEKFNKANEVYQKNKPLF